MTLATSVRVLSSLRRDPRTVALVLLVPCVLLGLFRWLFQHSEASFQHIGLPLLGIFPLTSLFLVSSITMLRERLSGTLERLMTMPVHKLDLIGGYALAFAVVAVAQGCLSTTVATQLLGLNLHGHALAVVVLAVLNATLGMTLGLLVSAFAQTEFQAVQFFPALIVPQLVLCGIIVPRQAMADALQWVARVLPISYAYDGLQNIETGAGYGGDIVIVIAFIVGLIVLAATTLRRQTD